MDLILLLLLLFFVAVMYSTVGHGGASGYLAVMSLLSINPDIMRSSALILNLIVSGIAFYGFRKAGYFRSKIFIPLAVTSIPSAFIGAGLPAETDLYKFILGIILLFAALKVSGLFDKMNLNFKVEFSLINAMITGTVLGFVSGLIGIGGGIILSPLLLFLGWCEIKQTAGVSALFIFVNSASGLFRLSLDGLNISSEMTYMTAAVFTGGLIGSQWGSKYANNKALRISLSLVLFIASMKLIFV